MGRLFLTFFALSTPVAHGEGMVSAPSSMLQQALRLHREGRLDRAAKFYHRVLRDNPGQSDALHGLGVIALQQRDFEKAIERFKAALAVRQDVFSYYYDLGEAWRMLGRKSEAVVAYMRAAELDRHSFDALLHLGTLLCELIRPAEGAQATAAGGSPATGASGGAADARTLPGTGGPGRCRRGTISRRFAAESERLTRLPLARRRAFQGGTRGRG